MHSGPGMTWEAPYGRRDGTDVAATLSMGGRAARV